MDISSKMATTSDSELDLMLLRSGTAVDHRVMSKADEASLSSGTSLTSVSSSEWYSWQWSPRTHYTYVDSDRSEGVPMPHMARYPILYYADRVSEERRRRASFRAQSKLDKARRRITFDDSAFSSDTNNSFDATKETEEEEEHEVRRVFKHVHRHIKRFYIFNDASSDHDDYLNNSPSMLNRTKDLASNYLYNLILLSTSFILKGCSTISTHLLSTHSLVAPGFSRLSGKLRAASAAVRGRISRDLLRRLLIPLLLMVLIIFLLSMITSNHLHSKAFKKSQEIFMVGLQGLKSMEEQYFNAKSIGSAYLTLSQTLTLLVVNGWSGLVTATRNNSLWSYVQKTESRGEREKIQTVSIDQLISKLQEELNQMLSKETDFLRQRVSNGLDLKVESLDLKDVPPQPQCPSCSSIVKEQLQKWQQELDKLASALNKNFRDLDEQLQKFEQKIAVDQNDLLSLIQSSQPTPFIPSSPNKTIKGNTVDESPELLEMTRRLIRSHLAIYDADKTGRFDYALETSGGSVMSIRCTESLTTRTTIYALFGVIPLWFSADLRGGPRAALNPDTTPGNCWAFKGAIGHLVIELSRPVVVEAFVMEHTSLKREFNSSIAHSAPKNFEVYGLRTEFDDSPHLFGSYMYESDGPSLQSFPVHNVSQERFSIVELAILSNHNNTHPYTCLYRFRVHGRP